MATSKILAHLKSQEHTDGVLECNGQEWPVHKIKLVDLSEFFKNAFSKKHGFQEGISGRINLGTKSIKNGHGDGPVENEELAETLESVENMLTFVYLRKDVPIFQAWADDRIDDEDDVDTIVRWHLDARRWQYKFMFHKSCDTFRTENHISVALQWAVLEPASAGSVARFTSGLPLTTFCAIAESFSVLPNEDIRAKWVWMAAANWTRLRAHPSGQEFREFIKTKPELMIDIIDLCNSKPEWMRPLRKEYETDGGYDYFRRPLPGTEEGGLLVG